jgi:phosphoenolpyruvate-protein kinase (PTS system EI component)
LRLIPIGISNDERNHSHKKGRKDTSRRFLAETKPSLGRRGSACSEYPELLRTHLRAVLELTGEFDVHVLVRMVALPDDVMVVKEHLMQVGL